LVVSVRKVNLAWPELPVPHGQSNTPWVGRAVATTLTVILAIGFERGGFEERIR
jgi:hypothetical protein